MALGGVLATTGCGDDITDPGALIAVRLAGRAGVLLDGLSPADADRAAADLLARPAEFWRARAEMQIETTLYRLVYRNFYYDEEEGKRQLPLPPKEVWSVRTQAPVRATIDGHDLVLVRYTFDGTLLTSQAEAAAADPALARIGGATQEAFVLPADPDQLLERTGMACMNESGFPPNSVDSENARAFFDDTCTADSVGDEGCHVVPGPLPDCVTALEDSVGTVPAVMKFERIAWDATRAEAARVGEQTTGGPQLRALAAGLEDARLVYRYFEPGACAIAEGCVGGTGWRRLLQFSASVENLGDTPAQFGDVTPGGAAERNNIIELSDCHGHYHFSHYGKFSYGTDGSLGSKRAFCLESTSRYVNSEDSPLTHDFSCDNQGIAPGWGDDYIAGLDCQWIDVTGVAATADVTAPLAFQVNPDGFLCEGEAVLDADGAYTFESTAFVSEAGEPVNRLACTERDAWEADNTVAMDFTIPREGSYVTLPCTRGQQGVTKNCGFVEQEDLITCTPGATVTLGCATAATAGQAIRVCHRSAALGTGLACTYLDALATGTIDSSVAEASITFTCPGALGAGEPGGQVSLFVAPMVDGDAVATVTCGEV